MQSLREELKHLINRRCLENGSNTPDFILSQFLTEVLEAFDVATVRRDEWYNRSVNINRDALKKGHLGINPLWLRDDIQFPRLLAEIMATQDVDVDTLCDSMNLQPVHVHELFERAVAKWDNIKEELK